LVGSFKMFPVTLHTTAGTEELMTHETVQFKGWRGDFEPCDLPV
jgi:hypothetical protein